MKSCSFDFPLNLWAYTGVVMDVEYATKQSEQNKEYDLSSLTLFLQFNANSSNISLYSGSFVDCIERSNRCENNDE